MDLKDKVVVITGGGQGLGRSMAEGFAARGAHLALVDLNQEKLDETKQLCIALGGKASTFIANVADEADVTATFDKIVAECGGVDVLVNNAGITRDGLFVKVKEGKVVNKMSMEQWDAVIAVNLTGTFLCGREAAVRMIEGKREGVIINIASISRWGNMGQTNYSATKAGVESMAVTWAKELARYGIRASSIAPGYIGTEMVMSMKPEALAKLSAMIPCGRIGEPDEIAHTVQYIMENDFVNGRNIEVDGGMRL